ncbi:MAG: MaoC/PaaZ C-terminal domain-containing protein [Actinomycetota bacterium]
MTSFFEGLEVGAEIPTLARVVLREDIATYADASGDHNVLHLDDDAARSAGFDGIIAHGMFTMGHMAACVVAWAGPGAQLRRIVATFRSPVSMGDVIVGGGRIRALDADAGTATIDTWVTVDRDGGTEFPVKRGEAVVYFP